MKMSFQGLLEPDETNLRWVIVRVPFDPTKVWPERKLLRVKGTIRNSKNAEGFSFRTSTARDRKREQNAQKKLRQMRCGPPSESPKQRPQRKLASRHSIA
jgi:hypothetical protein